VSTRISIFILTLGAFIVALAYAAVFAGTLSVAPWLLAAGATLVLTGLGTLGAGERAPRLATAIVIACVFTFTGLAAALVMPAHVAGGPLLLGLPRATTVMLLCTGLVPLVGLPIAYAWLFKREVLRDE
jgi:hypothetical protein